MIVSDIGFYPNMKFYMLLRKFLQNKYQVVIPLGFWKKILLKIIQNSNLGLLFETLNNHHYDLVIQLQLESVFSTVYFYPTSGLDNKIQYFTLAGTKGYAELDDDLIHFDTQTINLNHATARIIPMSNFIDNDIMIGCCERYLNSYTGPGSIFYKNNGVIHVGNYYVGKRHGSGREYHKNGSVEVGNWLDDKKCGWFVCHDDNGKYIETINYIDDYRQGSSIKKYHKRFITVFNNWDKQKHGSVVKVVQDLISVGFYEHGKRHGSFFYRYKNSDMEIVTWNHGKKVSEEVFLGVKNLHYYGYVTTIIERYHGIYKSEATKFSNGTMKIDYYRHNKLINSKIKFHDNWIYHIERDICGAYKYIRYSLVAAVKNSRRGGCVLI